MEAGNKTNALRVLILFALTLWLGFLPAPAAGQTTPPDAVAPEDWLGQALEREIELTSEKTITSTDGMVSIRVPGSPTVPQLFGENYYYFTTDLGSEVPAECFLYSETQDLSSFLQLASTNLFTLLSTQGLVDSVEDFEIENVTAGAIGMVAYLGVDWLYSARKNGELLVGQITHRAAVKDGRTLHCTHNELGFVKTFETLFETVVESSTWAAPQQEGRLLYSETWVGSIRDIRGTVMVLEVRDIGDDVYRIEERSSILLPVARQELMAQDEYNIGFSLADGTLTNALNVHVESGEITTNLALDPVDDGSWAVSGTFTGKDYATDLPATEIPSTLGASFALREFLANAETDAILELPAWSSSIDPSTFEPTLVTYRGTAPDGYRAGINLGGAKLDAEFDTQGMMRAIQTQFGHLTLNFSRVEVSGELPQAP